MSARRAFVLGAIVGAGVLAAAVSPGAGHSQAVRAAFDTTPPTVMPIVATFVKPVTTYSVSASDADGDTLDYKWAKQQATPCGVFTGGDSSTATWSHPDKDLTPPGDCPAEPVHAAVITVTITDGHGWTCTAVDLSGSAATTGFAATCTRPSCDKEQAALAAATARLGADHEALVGFEAVLASAQQALAQASADFAAVNTLVNNFLEVVGLSNAVANAVAAVKSAVAEVIIYSKLVDGQKAAVKQDVAAVKKASDALLECLNGQGSSLRVEALAGSAARPAADCSGPAKALGRAQGKAKAYQRLHALFSRAHFGTALTKLHTASATLRRLEAAAAAHKGGARVAAALRKLATSLDREAAALGKIATTTRSFAASAKAAAASVPTAKAALAKCQATPPPPSVSISEDDTWAYNTAIGKGNICTNVRTNPAQASISATLSGPNGYQAKLDKTPLKTDGSIQILSPITVGGDYTKTLTVYDATGKQTGTVTKTFTVAAPPKDGPATTPPCPKPTQ